MPLTYKNFDMSEKLNHLTLLSFNWWDFIFHLTRIKPLPNQIRENLIITKCIHYSYIFLYGICSQLKVVKYCFKVLKFSLLIQLKYNMRSNTFICKSEVCMYFLFFSVNFILQIKQSVYFIFFNTVNLFKLLDLAYKECQLQNNTVI